MIPFKPEFLVIPVKVSNLDNTAVCPGRLALGEEVRRLYRKRK